MTEISGKRKILLASACILLFLTACSSTDSNNVASEGVGANISVEAAGDGHSYVEAHLYVGSGGLFHTDLQLENGDRLTVTAGEQTKILKEEHSFFGNYLYTTSFDVDDSETEFVVSFDRAVGTDATNSRVVLPASVDFTQPAVDEVFNLGEAIVIGWQGAKMTGTLGLSYSTSCPTLGGSSVFSGSRSISDSGTYTVSTENLLGPAAAETPGGETCTTYLNLTRSNTGQLDPNFGEGGKITAKQVRERRISIRP